VCASCSGVSISGCARPRAPLSSKTFAQVVAALASVAGLAAAQTVHFVSAGSNDIFTSLISQPSLPFAVRLHADLGSALAAAVRGDALLALNDAGYPTAGFETNSTWYAAFAAAGVAAFWEMPVRGDGPPRESQSWPQRVSFSPPPPSPTTYADSASWCRWDELRADDRQLFPPRRGPHARTATVGGAAADHHAGAGACGKQGGGVRMQVAETSTWWRQRAARFLTYVPPLPCVCVSASEQGATFQDYPLAVLADAVIGFAEVAGVDVAVYGLPPPSQLNPVLFNASLPSPAPAAALWISAIKLSAVRSSRWTPVTRWQAVWSFLFAQLLPSVASTFTFPAWTPLVTPTSSAASTAALVADLRLQPGVQLSQVWLWGGGGGGGGGGGMGVRGKLPRVMQ